MNVEIVTVNDRETWNSALATLPGAHILQSWEWGEFKRVTGWQPIRVAYTRAGAVVGMVSMGVRQVGPFNALYAPKGAVLDYSDTTLAAFVLDHLQQIARHYRAVWLKIDPDVIAASGDPNDDPVPGTPEAGAASLVQARENMGADPVGTRLMGDLRDRRWRFSRDQVQFRNTVVIDLARPLDAILASMNQSTRRKIRIAEKAGVTIRHGSPDDLDLLYTLYQTTGARDGFLIRPRSYYVEAWARFMEAGMAEPLIAEYQGRAIAHVILYTFGRTCWYFYGASSDDARDAMPNYGLQWAALQWAHGRGMSAYDMWGAPDSFSEGDPLWGVYQFKRGFRGAVTRHVGAWDYVPFPPLYTAYENLMPRVRAWLRGRAATPDPSHQP